MEFNRLGNTGLIVSRLAFGAMTFGQDPGPMGKVWKTGQQEADRLVQRSLDSGINFFDTANRYSGGQSEVMLGKALGKRRHDVILSTKIGFRENDAVINAGASARHLINALEGSLERLGTDYVDLLSIHKPDPFTPAEETARALDNLVQRGMVRYIGYSNLSAWEAAKFVGIQDRHGWARFCAAQMYYSLVGRDLENEILPFCQDAGIGIVAWSPLASGFLTGRYSREDPTGGGGRMSDFEFIPTDKDKGYAAIERMKAIAGARGATVAQVAIAWLLGRPGVSTVLLGASKMSQLEDNLQAIHVNLSKEEILDLDRITAPALTYPRWFQQKTLDEVSSRALHYES